VRLHNGEETGFCASCVFLCLLCSAPIPVG
jgi:hypothetical protein